LNLRPLDPQSARNHVHPSQPVPPLPPTCRNRLNLSLRPTMFRTACDNSVTTSAARQPTNSKPDHPEMPAGKPDLHQTRPGQPSPLPTTARQRLIANRHDSPSAIRTPQPLRAPAVSFHSAHSPLSDLAPPTFSPASAAWPAGTLTKHPHASRRRRPRPSHRRRSPRTALCRARQP